MKLKRKPGEIAFDITNVVFMILIMILMLYPMLYVIFASLSKVNLLVTNKGFLFYPLGFTLGAYKAALVNQSILSGFKNTLLVLVVGVAINLLMTSMAAYFLSRKNVLWKNAVMGMIVLTMYFNGGLIPTYLNMRDLHLYDSIWALILPYSVSAFNLIIMRTSFMSIPDSMEESAVIDGANDFTILFRIIIPLAMPVVAVMILFYGVYHWNSWFPATIYIRNRKLLPVQPILREILIQNDLNSISGNQGVMDGERVENYSETLKYAIVVIVTLPILCIYPFIQKYFVKGVMIGAVKG